MFRGHLCAALSILNKEHRHRLQSIFRFLSGNSLHLTSAISSLSPDNTQGGAAIHVLRSWISNSFSALKAIPDSDMMTLLLQLTVVAATLEQGDTSVFAACRALGTTQPLKLLMVYPPNAPLRRQKAVHILNDLLDALECTQPFALNSGVRFLT